jgi:hypothetical protein
MGRRPEGEQALTGAERQARYRLRLAAAATIGAPQTVRPRTPLRGRTRPQRWHAAVAELVALQAEYAGWLEALPEATRDSATDEALQAIADLDLDEIIAIAPPHGYGRDQASHMTLTATAHPAAPSPQAKQATHRLQRVTAARPGRRDALKAMEQTRKTVTHVSGLSCQACSRLHTASTDVDFMRCGPLPQPPPARGGGGFLWQPGRGPPTRLQPA